MFGENHLSGVVTATMPSSSPKKVSATEQEIEILNSETKLSLNLVSQLREKLNPVLRSESSDREKSGIPVDALVPIANVIRENRFNVQNVNASLRDFLERIEL